MPRLAIAKASGLLAAGFLSVATCAVGPTSARAFESRLTPSAYRAKANAICADLNRYRIPVNVPFVKGMQGALRKTRAALAALRKLEPPFSLARLHAQVLRVEARYVTYVASLIAKVQAHTLTPSKMIAALARSPDARAGEALWRKLGVNVCAKS